MFLGSKPQLENIYDACAEIVMLQEVCARSPAAIGGRGGC